MIKNFRLFESNEQKIKLIDALEGEVPHEEELIWNFIGSADLDSDFSIIDIDVEFYYNKIKDSIDNAESWQRKLIKYYTNHIDEIINRFIIVSGNTLIDGNHRIVAFHNKGIKTVKGIDISE